MDIKNRLVIIIFFLINSPILAIIGLIILSLIDSKSTILPDNVKQNLNWFSLNPDLSHNIINILFGLAGIFAILAIYNIIASITDKNSDLDA